MKHGFIVAGVAALAITAPALAEAPIPLHGGNPPYAAGCTDDRGRAGSGPGIPAIGAAGLCGSDDAPEAAERDRAAGAFAGLYMGARPLVLERRTVSLGPRKIHRAACGFGGFCPGRWELHPNGWVWVQSGWDYPGTGSSMPPSR
jgi:hypothetical protein